MKNLLFILSIILLSSCNGKSSYSGNCNIHDVKESSKTTQLNRIYLMDQVDQGLYKIEIDDSITILLYRGTESCTMIQIK